MKTANGVMIQYFHGYIRVFRLFPEAADSCLPIGP